MNPFDKAWTVLKDDFIEDERDPNDPDQRQIIAWGKGDDDNPEHRHGKPIFQPHSKEEILDLMVQHGALVGNGPEERTYDDRQADDGGQVFHWESV